MYEVNKENGLRTIVAKYKVFQGFDLKNGLKWLSTLQNNF